jgi:hypothetical protein
MNVKHEKALREFSIEAEKLVQKIHQEWGSAAPSGGFQEVVNVDMPKHGPDTDLEKIEGLLGSVVAAIGAYLRRPPEGGTGA